MILSTVPLLFEKQAVLTAIVGSVAVPPIDIVAFPQLTEVTVPLQFEKHRSLTDKVGTVVVPLTTIVSLLPLTPVTVPVQVVLASQDEAQV